MNEMSLYELRIDECNSSKESTGKVVKNEVVITFICFMWSSSIIFFLNGIFIKSHLKNILEEDNFIYLFF